MNKDISRKFSKARRFFPVTDRKSGIVYLNAAATGPLSERVKKKMDLYYESCLYLDKDDDEAAFADLDKIRSISAKLIGARKSETGYCIDGGAVMDESGPHACQSGSSGGLKKRLPDRAGSIQLKWPLQFKGRIGDMNG